MAASVTELLTAAGVHARPLRTALDLLCAAPRSLDELVRATALPRRTVEELISALGRDAEPESGSWRLPVSTVDTYRALAASPPDISDGVLRPVFEAYLTDVPTPLRALDHVQADVDTMLRRARWLDETYHLPGARLLCVGDHDLTALAACTRRPELSATVVDVDDRLLDYVDRVARARGLDIQCLHADFRVALPPAAVGCADLVFTDPPYTPEGIRLFLARAVESLRDPEGRVVVAYGYSPRTPALGWKVQQEILRLGLVFEAVLPNFNRYHGAQAVGSASDLYVLQQTARSSRLAESAVREVVSGIYTHGPQSVESVGTAPDATAELLRLTGAPAASAPAWTEPARTSGPVAYDLMADPGSWLARVLLAGPMTGPVGALVPNNHADISDQRGQTALRELVADKYSLTFHRSIADGRHAVVLAEPTPTGNVRTALLTRVHGKLANVWREALIAAAGGTLTKREARSQVAELAPAADLDQRLIDLPMSRIRAILQAAQTS
ncbi:bis-aminopropyl spermidine synthase family protein [Actinokineospora enzanensis]|uniref:bis-aminopropyl spermidine synthase family protein n=1 Tax=Actinokineospora enzanensis TaxID=155975 RepID=UPI00035CB9A7|nr:bis-aminopropyl spermidine synthase family protein [Actinokineospora enzanensis]